MKGSKVQILDQETSPIPKVKYSLLNINSIIFQATKYKSEPTSDGGFKYYIHTNQTTKELNYMIQFIPPFTVRLEVVFPGNRGWKFNQVHYCIPCRPNKTRFFFRSFRNWLKFIPEFIFKRSNQPIVAQDTIVLIAQRLRLEEGSSRWNLPISSDAPAISYKKWFEDNIKDAKLWFK
jgi:hypothetical protein